MEIYGTDNYFITGIKELLRKEKSQKAHNHQVSSPIVVMSGMQPYEAYPFLLSIKPRHYTIFVSSERYFDSIKCLFPGMIKLLISDKTSASEFLKCFLIVNRMCEQNERKPYFPENLKFSKAEVEVLALIHKGHSIREVAAIRGVSPKTISVQRKILMARMGIKSSQSLISLSSVVKR
ncbi:helix-turn-helix transcriptional regulator [Klebsiella quasipneumoniae]|nr:helix-turn-helix transcriptional regulator [Klebsiella quasipneumoniae]